MFEKRKPRLEDHVNNVTRIRFPMLGHITIYFILHKPFCRESFEEDVQLFWGWSKVEGWKRNAEIVCKETLAEREIGALGEFVDRNQEERNAPYFSLRDAILDGLVKGEYILDTHC